VTFAIDIPIAAVGNACRRHGVLRLRAFGSCLRDDFADDSDIDFLVEFLPGASQGVFALARLQHDLERTLGREVDLTTPRGLSRYFRDEVLAAAKVIYESA